MTARRIAAALKADIDRNVPRLHVHSPDLGEAVATMNEGGGWPAGVEIKPEAVVECWRVMEYVRNSEGPIAEEFKL